jgi:hypothetical protein
MCATIRTANEPEKSGHARFASLLSLQTCQALSSWIAVNATFATRSSSQKQFSSETSTAARAGQSAVGRRIAQDSIAASPFAKCELRAFRRRARCVAHRGTECGVLDAPAHSALARAGDRGSFG